MTSTRYELATIEGHDMAPVYNGTDAASAVDALKLTRRQWRHRDGNYDIIKYDKGFLSFDRVPTAGLLRSVICKNGKILCFAPPKAMEPQRFEESYTPDACVIEEYVEGTMINVFWDQTIGDEGDWEIATRSSVGAKMAFFTAGSVTPSDTFRGMFLETCNNVGLEFDYLDKSLCYSFVLQHPKNRIVVPFSRTSLYLVACYKIDNETKTITSIPREEPGNKLRVAGADIRYPEPRGEWSSWDELKAKWASGNTEYRHVGVMVYHKETGTRTKFRNPNYEMVRKLRGNQPKEQYRYLSLRSQGKMREYLQYYPEDKESFNMYRNQVHDFTKQLHSNYLSCYVRKEDPLRRYPYQYRTHMYELHQRYIETLRPQGGAVTKSVVIEYVNGLHPAKLMFSLNYSMRQNLRDEQVAEEEQEVVSC